MIRKRKITYSIFCVWWKSTAISKKLTPEIIRSFVDKIIVHEKRKEKGHYRQEVEIVYNFIGAVEFPDFVNEEEYYGLEEQNPACISEYNKTT